MNVFDHKPNACSHSKINTDVNVVERGENPTRLWIDFLKQYGGDLSPHDIWCAFGLHYPEMIDRIKAECRRVNGFVPYQQGYVYCIQAIDTNYYKLGKTNNPDRRLLQIAPKMPFNTRFVKVWPTNFMDLAEKWLHKEFAEYRTNGEWFELTPSEFHEFFMDDDCTFGDQLRHIYCLYFFENLKAPCFFDALDSVAHDQGSHKFTLVTAELAAWIEGLFGEAVYSDFRFADDVQSQYSSKLESFFEEVAV